MPKKGYKQSAEHREKNRLAKLGTTPWNKGTVGVMKPNSTSFKKGDKSWLAGKKLDREQYPNMGHHTPHTKEAREKMSKKLRGKFTGELHWNWQGGKSSENYLERRRFQHTVQKEVMERDDYTCQICNQRGGYLQVDHIEKWADNIERRFDVDNCRTLCMSCHYKETFNREIPDGVVWGHNLSRRIAS
jgi:hypothetical protein